MSNTWELLEMQSLETQPRPPDQIGNSQGGTWEFVLKSPPRSSDAAKSEQHCLDNHSDLF